MLEISIYLGVGLAWTLLLTLLIIIDAIALSYFIACLLLRRWTIH